MKSDKNLQAVVNALGLGSLGILGLLYVVALIVLRAWCITKMWLWFVVPLGVPAIGIAGAIGLVMTVSVALALDRLPSNKTVFQGVVGTLVATGFAWCVHLFL